MQRYLRYIAQSTSNQAIIDLATIALNALVQQGALPKNTAGTPVVTIGDFDLDRTFIDKREVIIPGFVPLDDQTVLDLVTALFGEGTTLPTVEDPVPALDPDLEVAADGIYMEVAAGTCVLDNVPPPPRFIGSLTAQDVNVSIGGG